MKKTLRYRRDLVGLMVIGVASGSCNVILAGGGSIQVVSGCPWMEEHCFAFVSVDGKA